MVYYAKYMKAFLLLFFSWFIPKKAPVEVSTEIVLVSTQDGDSIWEMRTTMSDGSVRSQTIVTHSISHLFQRARGACIPA